ncbi:MAG: hypothetical protein AAF567_11665 [Actinomycetota bacterium]
MVEVNPVELPRTSAVQRAITLVLAHIDRWGAVWFGFVFWGSVIFAAARRIWPDAPTPGVLAGSLLIGLGGGLAARRRGYWL